MYYGEKLNAWTHVVGAVLALGGAVLLIVVAARDGDVVITMGAGSIGGVPPRLGEAAVA